MPPDRFHSLMTRQLNALDRARRQVAVFREGLAKLDAVEGPWLKANASQLALWLQERGVPCSRRKANWTPKTVSDRLYFRLDTDALRGRVGAMEIGMKADQDLSDDPVLQKVQIELARRSRKLKRRLDDLNGTTSTTITDAILTFADRLDRDAEAVGREIRAGFDI